MMTVLQMSVIPAVSVVEPEFRRDIVTVTGMSLIVPANAEAVQWKMIVEFVMVITPLAQTVMVTLMEMPI